MSTSSRVAQLIAFSLIVSLVMYWGYLNLIPLIK